MIWTLLSSIIGAVAGLAIYIYYLRKGQFENPEEVKYQLFREEHPDN
jgi:homoserine kinase